MRVRLRGVRARAWASQPVIAGRAILSAVESDGFFRVRAKIPITSGTERASLWMADGVHAELAVAVDLSDLSCAHIMPTAELCPFGLEIAHCGGKELFGRKTKTL